jgi:site-specific DNA recombinase
VLTEATETTAAKYLRISEDRNEDEAGVGRQDELAGKLIAERGYALTAAHGPGCEPGTFSDNDLSATQGKPRPGYLALMAAAERGEFTVIVVYHLSRLWRNRIERAQGIELLRKAGVSVVCARGPSLDLTTAYGRGMTSMLGEFDTMEAEIKGERTRDAQVKAAQAGLHLGGPRPFGWNIVPDPRREGQPNAHRPVLPMVNEAEAAEIRRIARAVLEGRSLASLCRDLNDHGVSTTWGRPWGTASLRNMLKRERNYGVVVFGGMRFEGAWPAILDEETVRKVTALLDDPGRATHHQGNKVKSLLTGIATCGVPDPERPGGVCGEKVKTGTKEARGGGRRRMYKCPREHLFRAQDAVDHVAVWSVIDQLKDMEPDERLALFTEDDPGAPLAAEAAGIRKKLDLLVDMELDGTITREEHRRRRAGLRAQLTAAERKMGAVSRTPVLGSFLSARDIHAAWEALPLDRKRAILNELIEVVILPARRGYTLSRHEPVWNTTTVRVGIKWRLAPPGLTFDEELAQGLWERGQLPSS